MLRPKDICQDWNRPDQTPLNQTCVPHPSPKLPPTQPAKPILPLMGNPTAQKSRVVDTYPNKNLDPDPDIEALEKAGLQEKIRYMEDLLKEVPTLLDRTQESRHIRMIIGLIL